jgi:hypothetical protein
MWPNCLETLPVSTARLNREMMMNQIPPMANTENGYRQIQTTTDREFVIFPNE